MAPGERGKRAPRPAALVFDLDGTLVDSEPLSQQVWQRFLTARGLPFDPAVYAQVVGRRSQESVRLMKSHYRLPEAEEEIARQKGAIWRSIWQRGLPPRPGLPLLRAALLDQELPWAVATSSPRAYAEQVLTQLGLRHRCQAVVGGDEVAQGKPAPDGYLLAAARLGVEPGHCWAVEDSAPGCQAALRAGMTVVAIPGSVPAAGPLPPVHYLCHSLAELAAMLRRSYVSPAGDGAGRLP